MFTVLEDTKVEIRRVGTSDWKKYTTRRTCRFDTYEPTDNGGKWLFRQDGWEMKVCPALIVRKKKKTTRYPYPQGTFNKCILGRNGRGSRRRRNRR